MLIELRHYTCRPGQREAWVKFMEEVIIPFQEEKGIAVLGSFIGEEDPDAYYWIRGFADEEDRKRKYDAVYSSPTWNDEISPRVLEMIDREAHKITRLVPTPGSAMK